MTDNDTTNQTNSDEPMTLQNLRVIVSPETDRGTRTVVIRQGTQTDAGGPLVLERDQRATASIAVTAEENDHGASVSVGTDLYAETLAADGGRWATVPDDLSDDSSVDPGQEKDVRHYMELAADMGVDGSQERRRFAETVLELKASNPPTS